MPGNFAKEECLDVGLACQRWHLIQHAAQARLHSRLHVLGDRQRGKFARSMECEVTLPGKGVFLV